MSLRTPKYRLHKGSGQALVQINGQRVYLGKYGTEASKERYRKTIAEWLASGHRTGCGGFPSAAATQVTVNELILAFWEHAKKRYVKNGEPTSELRSYRTALRPVRRLYGREPVAAFGPLALVACRQKLIEAGTCRRRVTTSTSHVSVTSSSGAWPANWSRRLSGGPCAPSRVCASGRPSRLNPSSLSWKSTSSPLSRSSLCRSGRW